NHEDKEDEEKNHPWAPGDCPLPSVTTPYTSNQDHLGLWHPSWFRHILYSTSLNRELQEKENVNEVVQDSQDECHMTSSSSCDLSDSHQPSGTTVFLSDEQEDCSTLDVASEYSHCKENKAPNGLPVSLHILCVHTSVQIKRFLFASRPWRPILTAENHEDEEDEEEKEPLSQMNDQGRIKDRQNMERVLERTKRAKAIGGYSHRHLCGGPNNLSLNSNDKFSLLTHHREFGFLIRVQARELSQLRQKIGEGRDFSILLNQHLKDLLTHSDLDNSQGQGFQEQLAEGRRLSEGLVSKLSPHKVATGLDCIEPLQGP
ncbi:hypothetical protein HPG69_000888, partial [Diceros bicornis minor]